MLRTQTSDSPWECDSCKNRPTKTLPDHKKLVMIDIDENDLIDIDENDLEFELYHLCRDCAKKLHEELGDILEYTSKEIEPSSIRGYIEKIIAESDLVEVTFPDGATMRATKFSESSR